MPQYHDLIVITDEVRATEHNNPTTSANTPKHFAKVLLPLLEDPHRGRDNSYVIKNVGDSLLMRVSVSTETNEVTTLLSAILETQKQLGNKLEPRESIRIRVIVATCGRCVPGQDIGTAVKKELGDVLFETARTKYKMPRPRTGDDQPWFEGDLFGYKVSAAFRAAAIPKGPELVIDDGVAELLFRESGENLCLEAITLNTGLCLGARVAFAPIKGLEDYYTVGNGYLWLREVSAAHAPLALVHRRRKAKVVTEIWCGKVNDTDISECIDTIHTIDKGAGFFSAIADIQWVAGVTRNKRRKATVSECRSAADIPSDDNGLQARVVVLGAYPELDTYWDVRSLLHDRQTTIHGKSVTSLVWEGRNNVAHMDNIRPGVHWMFPSQPSMVFIKFKAFKEEATDDPRTDPLVQEINRNTGMLDSAGYTIQCAGLLMGEWDAYAVFCGNGNLNETKVRTVAETVAQTLNKMTEAVVYMCRVATTASPAVANMEQ